MRLISSMAFLLCSAVCIGQVLTPMEVDDPDGRLLQERYLHQLEATGAEIQAHHFPYNFYLSRDLDLNEDQQRAADQRSIHFEKFKERMALEVTGNYYASYSAEKLGQNQRARQTFNDVVLPILKIVGPDLFGDASVQAYAFEISHHVRGKVMGLSAENPENLVVVVPRAAAQRLVTAQGAEQQQGALLDSEVYVNGQRVDLWLSDDSKEIATEKQEHRAADDTRKVAKADPNPDPTVSPKLFHSSMPARLLSKEDLDKLRDEYLDTVASMRAGISDQVHFVDYAPPTFIAFHQGAYLQIPMTSNVATSAIGSRYRLAAFAFDDHIAHLIRPVLVYFQKQQDFDGVDFSTTVKAPGVDSSEAVEFFLPFDAMRCYANYECTGQELLNAGIVLINGERVGLDLIGAESGPR